MKMDASHRVQALPQYLKKYIVEQRYDSYTPQDHAAWRYIMRQNLKFFSSHAVPIYAEGLRKTGIPIERIPRITEMDECLSEFGWGAVPVCGFIPPAAFLDFQARAVLPIACDMRTVQHLAYTPAPDIVHEAAGHAPIIADPVYSNYLHRYAKMAQKSIYSLEDIRLYEAIRYLSDIKENPDTSKDEIVKAEKHLEQTTASIKRTSEMSKVVRMSWWTNEYGLVGNMKDPKIYGAGLLSSVGESQNCLSSKVKKIPLTVDCVETPYDITEPQPQLFVAKSLEHLTDVLEDLEKNLGYSRGGVYAMEEGRLAEAVTHVGLDSGLQISGQIDKYLVDKNEIVFFKMSGKCQFALDNQEISGQGVERHAHGFSSPLGRWSALPSRSPASFTVEDLKKAGLVQGQKGQLEFVSGFKLTGLLKKAVWHQGKLIYLTWVEAKVTRGSEVFFEPEWGDFDLAIGERVVSVCGGPADFEKYGPLSIGEATTVPSRKTPFTAYEKSLFDAYKKIRDFRSSIKKDLAQLEKIYQEATSTFAEEWLLNLEVLELGKKLQKSQKLSWLSGLEKSLASKKGTSEEKWLIERGLAISEEELTNA